MDQSNGQRSVFDFQRSLLTDRQQLAASLVLAICLSIMLFSWVMRAIRHERVIDIERPFERRRVDLVIDLNQATWPELTLLPEISETMARRITDYRDIHGGFDTLEELKQVRGIGPRTFEQVQPFLSPIQPIPATVSQ